MASTSDDHPDGDLALTELLWVGRPAPRRGPTRTLDLDRIARAALRIADAEGLAAVSMQRVAHELDLTKMALYRYVTGKAELTALMIEAAVGEPPDLGAVAGGWRARIAELAERLAATWQRHPWLPWATLGDRVMGPREVGWIERAVEALDGAPLDGAEKMDAVFVICGHIRNTQSPATAGTQPWRVDVQLEPALRRLVPDYTDRYPALAAAVAGAGSAGADGAARGDNGRAFGLGCILDGLAALIATRSVFDGAQPSAPSETDVVRRSAPPGTTPPPPRAAPR
jgi:AcrR family transcriptional regulator